MKDYKELIEELRMAGRWIKHDDGSEETYLFSVDDCVEIADAIEQLAKERDALAKCFRITRTDAPFTNQAVFKIDYCDIIDKTADELVYVIAHGLVRAIRGEVNE